MNYSEQIVTKWRDDGESLPYCVRLCGDWLELHAEVERLREAAAAVIDAYEGSSAESCASPVLDAMFVSLRDAAGIKAPPQDGDAGDRADDAYERECK